MRCRVPGWTLADEAGIGIIIRATLKGEDQPRELDLLLAQARTRNSTLWAGEAERVLASSKRHLGDELHEQFSITLADMKPEYVN